MFKRVQSDFSARSKFSVIFVLLLLLLAIAISHSLAQEATESPETIYPPLELVWQTGGSPDEIIPAIIRIGVDSDGNVYVGSHAGLVPVRKFDSNGTFLTTFGTLGSGEGHITRTNGIAIDSQGNVFIIDGQDSHVLKFDANGNFLVQWDTEAPAGPSGIAVDADGNVYVANHRPHEHYVQKFDNNGELLAQWGTTGAEDGEFAAAGSQGLALDSEGNIYVVDQDNHRVQKFDSDGNILTVIGSYGTQGQGQFDLPSAIAFDGEDNMYVADPHFIQKFDADGQFVAQWSTTEGELAGCCSLGVDSQGNIYWLANSDVFSTVLEKNINITVLKKFRQTE